MTSLRLASRCRRILCGACWLGLIVPWVSSGAAAGTISQVPLSTAATAPPNVMLMIDNSGGMNNIVPDQPFDLVTPSLARCPAANLIATSDQVELRLEHGQPRIFIVGAAATFAWGASAGQRCFDPQGRYLAKLTADAGTAPSGYPPAEYQGNYLNWYYQVNNTTPNWNSGQQKKPGTATRLEITKEATKTLLESLDGVRIGLSTCHGSNGASILQTLTELRAGRDSLKTRVDGLVASGATPLAEALRDLGEYFAQGQSGPLLLHPNTSSPQLVSKRMIFSRGYTFSPPGPAPIEYFCQNNFAVLITAGRPSNDNDIAEVLRDYDGDCRNANPACRSDDRKPDQSYESSGTDFLDDVAKALHDIDLRPDLNDQKGDPVVNNLLTYTIGFGADQVINDRLLRDTAANGGGEFLAADHAAELSTVFARAANFVLSKSGSAAAVAVNGPKLSSESLAFQAVYNSGSWTGDLKAFTLDPSGGQVATLKWEAAKRLPPASARRLFTWDAASSQGVDFEWSSLSDAQRQALSLGPNGVGDDLGAQRLAYLRGETSGEQRLGGPFRNRISLLGDIVNADPVYVGNQNYGYDHLPGTEGSSYPIFRSGQAKNRAAMVYAGANDGFLHGFSAETGDEVFAFMPAASLPQTNQLTFPSYSHRFFVDGPPRAGDAFLSGAWRTILLGTPGAGGRGLFALDVTNPESFSAKQILWETASPDLGFVLGAPTLARLAGGRWVALTGNGYQSHSRQAMLLVYDLLTGALIQTLDTGVGPANGLSAPVPIDLNGDRVVDLVYAGDLQGNLWKFELGSSDPAEWRIALSGKPLFTARDNQGQVQPITSRPAVGRHPQSGVMVFFGTGKYFETGDNIPSQNLAIESFYGIWDQGSAVGRNDLAQHSILGEMTRHGRDVRTSTRLASGGKRGWFIDLAFPAGRKSGERVVSAPLLRHGRVIFPTITPSDLPCTPGGSSWLMELDAVTGGRLDYTVFDVDGNSKFEKEDYVTILDDGKAVEIPVSGLKRDALIETPGVVQGDDWETKYVTDADGNLATLRENIGPSLRTGRRSWRQLQ